MPKYKQLVLSHEYMDLSIGRRQMGSSSYLSATLAKQEQAFASLLLKVQSQ